MTKKMQSIKSNTSGKERISKVLKHNGMCHQSYKIYTSMDKALQFLLKGELYFSDGSKWNDMLDRKQMADKASYALCTSYSTKENVAMWMLYGDKNGTNGAVLNLTRTCISNIVNVQELQICKVARGFKDEVLESLDKTDSFDIFCTDIVYTSEVKNDGKKMKITCNGENVTIDKNWLDSDEIFSKKYEWRYESESRIVIKFSDAVQEKIKRYKEKIEEDNKKDKEGCKNAYLVIKLCVPKYRRIKEERVIRSPVYKGNISFGIDSALLNEIQW